MRHLSLVLASLLVACGATDTPAPSGPVVAVSGDPSSCRLSDGSIASDGASAASDDGCNTCSCGGAHWACTEMACVRPRITAPPSSAFEAPRAHYTTDGQCALTDGTTAAIGATAPSDDGCNSCTCGDGGWGCTEMDCL